MGAVQTKMVQEAKELKRTLSKPDTLIFICGLKGMEEGILPVLNTWGKDLGVKEPWVDVLKAEKRLLLEVY